MSDAAPMEGSSGSGPAIAASLLITLLLYFGAPILAIAPVLEIAPGAIGTVRIMFAPVVWLYKSSPAYEHYLDYQIELAIRIGFDRV